MILNIAGITLEYKTQFPSQMKLLFADYAVGEQEGLVPTLTLDPEPWLDTIIEETCQSPVNTEFYAFSVALGEQLPQHRRLQTHGVAIQYDGKSYIFTAPSGVGKSTRALIWQKYLGTDKVHIINGDKPILWFKENEVLACGSPWAGKEGFQENVCTPLGGICLLRRSEQNTIRKASGPEFFDFFLSQVQIPKNPQTQEKTFQLIEELYVKIPIYLLENDLSEQGFIIAFETLTGNTYQKQSL